MGAHRPGDEGRYPRRGGGSGPILCWRARRRFAVPTRWGWNPNGAGSTGSCSAARGAQRSKRGVGVEPCAHRPHLGDAPGERVGEQADDEGQNVMDQTHPALDPAHRPRQLDRIAAQRIARRGQARRLLGVGHHLFDLVQLPGKPRGQTVRQQAEGGGALRAVPASDARPARGLARVGPVACQRTSPVRVIGAALQPCVAPRFGPNVLLAGKPRVVAKLHRPWPGGVGLPRGPTPLSCEGVPRIRAGPCHAKRQGAGRVLRTGRDRASPEPCPNARPAIPNHPWARPSTPGAGRAPIATRHGPHDAAAAPALLRHPRKSVYATMRPFSAGGPRPIARNNRPWPSPVREPRDSSSECIRGPQCEWCGALHASARLPRQSTWAADADGSGDRPSGSLGDNCSVLGPIRKSAAKPGQRRGWTCEIGCLNRRRSFGISSPRRLGVGETAGATRFRHGRLTAVRCPIRAARAGACRRQPRRSTYA